jgi:hypothetical protein
LDLSFLIDERLASSNQELRIKLKNKVGKAYIKQLVDPEPGMLAKLWSKRPWKGDSDNAK